jgi:hypothetical protein
VKKEKITGKEEGGGGRRQRLGEKGEGNTEGRERGQEGGRGWAKKEKVGWSSNYETS